jgi:hypothetical protein
VNAKGTAVQMKKPIGGNEEYTTNVYRQAKLKGMVQKYDRLFDLDIAYEGKCTHDPVRACETENYVNGINMNSGSGIIIKQKIVFDEAICVASRAGYHLVRGNMVYLHTDGSLCRMLGVETSCSCGSVHVC